MVFKFIICFKFAVYSHVNKSISHVILASTVEMIQIFNLKTPLSCLLNEVC